jgi:Tfp pilus assembly protein PilF
MQVYNDEQLKHYGILGMKWGHHKSIDANVISKAAKTGQDITSLGQAVNKGGFNKNTVKEAKHLSDDDLKKLTNRLNLENNYINAKQQQSGRSTVENVLSIAGTTLAVASSAAILYETVSKIKG